MKIIICSFIFLPFFTQAQETIRVKKEHKGPWYNEIYDVLKSNKSIKHGMYLTVALTGDTLTQGFYKNGLKDSLWIEGNISNTRINAIGMYADDKRIGIWEYYGHKGDIEQQYNYSTGRLVYDKSLSARKEDKFTIFEGSDTLTVKLTKCPIFIGGLTNFMNKLQEILTAPEHDIRFILLISKDGKAKMYKNLINGTLVIDEEMTDRVNNIQGFWIPGELDGVPKDVVFKNIRLVND